MSAMWKRLDALAGRAVSAAFGEAVLVKPTLESDYTDNAPDTSRPERTIRGVFALEHDTEDFRGQRTRGEFSGVGRMANAAAYLQITAADYAALGYEVRRADRVVLTEQDGSPVYVVALNQPLDDGNVVLALTRG